MKRFVLTLVAFFAVTTLTVFAQPKLEIVGGETYDWGKVEVKDNPLKMVTLDAAVKLKNVGNQELIIDTVKVGCGCTHPTLEKKNLKPGETTTLGIGLNVALQSGEIFKNLTIFANDEGSKNGRIMYLKANIFRPLTVNPQSMNFNEVLPGEVAHSYTTFKNNDTKPFTISRLLATKGVKLEKTGPFTIAPGDTLHIDASYTAKEKGYWNAILLVETDSPDYAPFELSAYGNVKDPSGKPDPNVITIDPSKAKDGKIESPVPGATKPAVTTPVKKKSGK